MGTIVGHVKTFLFNGTRLNATAFLGIPYAEPPTGTRRFQKPTKKAVFTETLIANKTEAVCPQNPEFLRRIIDPRLVRQGEDCLYMNIYLPYEEFRKEQARTVMVWIYGGAYQYGSQDLFDAYAFAALNDVILVTFNYRLSIFGFLSTGDGHLPGNYGLWDQHMAIQWVSDNIKHFGGDPGKITLFGSSAGGASVVYQSLYGGNDGLFQRGIAQSGSSNVYWAHSDTPKTDFDRIAKKAGCLDDDNDVDGVETETVVSCLRNMSFTDINNLLTITDLFKPVVDGEFVKVHPADVFLNGTDTAWEALKEFGKRDFIFGFNSVEGARYLLEIEKIVGFTDEQLAKGHSEEMFRNGIISYVLTSARINSSELLVKEIEQEYTDWKDPTNKYRRRQKAVDFVSDVMFNDGTTKTALVHSKIQGNSRTFFYVYDHKTSVHPDGMVMGAYHTNEWIFVLGFPASLTSLTVRDYTGDPANHLTEQEIELSIQIMTYWTNFAKSGNPNTADNSSSSATIWPQYDAVNRSYIRFKKSNLTSFPVEKNFAASRMHFWQELVPYILKECDRVCETCEENKPVNKAGIFSSAFLFIFACLIMAKLGSGFSVTH